MMKRHDQIKSVNRTSIWGVIVLWLCAASPSFAQAPEARPVLKTVNLVPGVCATISEGDTVDFEWNPAFQRATADTQMNSFGMQFARNGEERFAVRTGGGLHLRAGGRRMNAANPLAPQIVAEPNGFYKVSFQVELHGALAGEYHLIDASAEAWNSPVHDAEPLAMTNSPTRMPFCLNVIESAVRGRS
jgi:hypothetical protein